MRLAPMKPRPSRSCETSGRRPSGLADPEPALGVGVDAGGGDAGSVQQKTAARKYSAATTRMTASGLARLTTSGPSSANPSANAALSVSVKTHWRPEAGARNEDRDHRRLGRARRTRSPSTRHVQQEDEDEVRRRRGRDDEHRRAAQHVRRDQDHARSMPIDVDAGHGAEQHGGHQEATGSAG